LLVSRLPRPPSRPAEAAEEVGAAVARELAAVAPEPELAAVAPELVAVAPELVAAVQAVAVGVGVRAAVVQRFTG
jgi:hypothetical protein